MIAAIFSTFTFLLVTLTIFTLSTSEKWWVRGADFPRLQFFVFAILLLGLETLFLPFRNTSTWIIVGLTTVSMIHHFLGILPFTRLHFKQVPWAKKNDAANTIKILVANVLQSNTRYGELLSLIQENVPQVFVTLETDKTWQIHLDQLEGDYPYSVKCPQDNTYGMHVYSKYPISNAQIEYLVMKDVPSIHAVVTLPSGVNVSMHFLHPIPPRPSDTSESTQRDAEILLVAKYLEKNSMPIIVTGDLNDVAWSKTTKLFLKLSRLLDPRIGRGMYNTFNAHHWFIRWPLDHLFHSKHFSLSFLKRLRKIGSDHFPVLIELVYVEQGNDIDVPEASHSEKKRAEEKINSQLSK